MIDRDLPEEVADFLEYETRLAEFRAKHFKVFQEYSQLLEQRNAALIAAEQRVRTDGKPYGPWSIHSTKTTIDAETLYEKVGREKFIDVGGKIETKKIFTVDKDKFKAAIALKQLPTEVVKKVMEQKTAWSGPKPGSLT